MYVGIFVVNVRPKSNDNVMTSETQPSSSLSESLYLSIIYGRGLL